MITSLATGLPGGGKPVTTTAADMETKLSASPHILPSRLCTSPSADAGPSTPALTQYRLESRNPSPQEAPSTSRPKSATGPESPKDGALVADASANPVLGERPLVPTSYADWEAKREVIYELYINKNLILNDVIDIMLSTQNFKATARMYKGQFAKWKWFKYRKPGKDDPSPNANAKSRAPRRKSFPERSTSPPSPAATAEQAVATTSTQTGPYLTQPNYHTVTTTSRQLEHQLAQRPSLLSSSDENLHVEGILRAYREYIITWSFSDKPWRPSPSPTSPLNNRDPSNEQPSLLQNVNKALNLFRQNQPAQGGALLQLSFLQIEHAIAGGPSDMEAIWDCALGVPQLCLTRGWTDMLVIFARHLHQLTRLRMAATHPLARMAASMAWLAQRDPAQLQPYVERAWRLWVDVVGALRGAQDHATIHLKRGFVILMRPDRAIVQTLIRDFATSVHASLAARGAQATTNRILELEQLLARMFIPLLSPESSARAQAMLLGILARIEAKPAAAWEYLDRYLFFSAYYFLASIADWQGERDKAADYRRRSLESPRDRFWVQTAMLLEEYLRVEGRAEEADEIAREREGVVMEEAEGDGDVDGEEGLAAVAAVAAAVVGVHPTPNLKVEGRE
ncbi:hypothetical protein B0T22DRAFT_534551 [Podospora appendiculata]|uniref:Clr5 domain-containing protein n=1 Tax=Podospora appendiculata TaxID=314037 RepID=A0AAE0XLN4_9PEZI|nr:hypothetical protein B0T22DRAFT_534551 [Podospora appendiculata]